MIKKLALILPLSFACAAMAEGSTCAADAIEKKPTGAAKGNFERKCVKDAVG